MEKQNWSYGTGGNGGLAQLGEHLPCKQGVESSNLLVSTGTYPERSVRLYLENRILKERRKKRHPRKKQEQEPPPPGATLGAGRGGRTGRTVQGTKREFPGNGRLLKKQEREFPMKENRRTDERLSE